MLLKYSVSNYKSIGHNIEFSMFPLEDNTRDDYLTKIETVLGNIKVLRRGAFFGPNASGKTSLISSIDFAKNYILYGPKSVYLTKVNQFRGDLDELGGLTTFQFMIYINKQVYTYGFSLNREYVSDEWLSVLTEKGFEYLFERKTDFERATNINIYTKYSRNGSKDRSLAEILKNSIRERQAGQLFLKKLAENGSNKAEIIFEWFKNINIIYPNSYIQDLPAIIKTSEKFRGFLTEKLNDVDTGVSDVFAVSEVKELSAFLKEYFISDEDIRRIEEAKSGTIQIGGKYFQFEEGKKKKITMVQVKFKHKLCGKNVDFNMEDESDGTKRMIDLLPILFNMNVNSNALFVVDELDRSLHTSLSKLLVEEFMKTNETEQLLFTAHDVNLIDLDHFREEEIWFVEKNSQGESRLRSLSDFDIVNRENVLRSYLAGRFGAIPVLRR